MTNNDLRRCSIEARGVWIDMLCLMFQCEPRGVLISGSRVWSRDDAADAVVGNRDKVRNCIDELIAKGVCRIRDTDSAMFSARMVADYMELLETRAADAARQNKKRHGAVTPVSRPPSRTELELELESESLGEVSPKTPLVREARKLSRFTPDDVIRVYEAYPRSIGRGAALQAIARALVRIANGPAPLEDPLAWLIARVEAFAKSPAGNAGKFTPHPATFFNQERYHDADSEWQRNEGTASNNRQQAQSANAGKDWSGFGKVGNLPILNPEPGNAVVEGAGSGANGGGGNGKAA